MTASTPIDEHAPDAARRFALERVFDPINLVLAPACGILVVARHYGAVAHEPLWMLLGAFVLSQVTAVALATCFPLGSSRSRPRLFLVVATASCGLLSYVTGWGSVLAVGLLAACAVVIHTDGARYGRVAILSILATIALGEAGVALGVFQTMLRSRATSHALAVLEAAVISLVVALIARGQREKECAQAREREAHERFRALVQYASDAIVVVEDGGRVTYASPAVEHVLGYAPEALESFDMSWIDPDHADVVAEVWRRLRAEPGSVASLDIPVRCADGASRWVEMHVTNLSDRPAVAGFVCNLRDLGKRHAAQQQLMHDAQHDPLTQLANRRCFLDRLDATLRDATPDDLVAALFVDIDHFKQINDEHGHAAGDDALVAVANMLSKLVRPSDLVARYGGDEFTILLAGLRSVDSALEIAERITQTLSCVLRINDRDVAMSASVGIATTSGRTKTAPALLQDADEAMYRAKRNGRARWESSDPSEGELASLSRPLTS